MLKKFIPYFIWMGLGLGLFSIGFWGLRATKSGNLFKVPEVTWRELGDFDYITGEVGAYLGSYDKKKVKIPGFMVPLEDDMKSVTEFLLVPTPQACIHVPPPPPNQMVIVKVKKEKGVPISLGPIWVYGDFNIRSVRHQYGESSFEMLADAIEVYK